MGPATRLTLKGLHKNYPVRICILICELMYPLQGKNLCAPLTQGDASLILG
ncbi:hypothetical protein SBDP1_230030 [Syntrophobacter sp. SbD1]|nr:hypothetical protein SBDP1_230030 [Syntrophobacter sp. SbD1]